MADTQPDPWADTAADIRRTRDAERRGYVEQAEIWQARATQAEARVAELEAEAKALADDRGQLMRVLAAQTGETVRLRGACEQAEERVARIEAAVGEAIGRLLDDTPRLALQCLRAALARPAGEPDHA